MVVVCKTIGKENAVRQFITKHRDKITITGTISCRGTRYKTEPQERSPSFVFPLKGRRG